ncbi:hypothetical protein hmeg3_07665 [Herbaspirillum sp. meg3]|uniref:hypothetical protein n=1 Tax=Herbaspirillum sp. meg3 TaxID=2025949 RepID=UPI000B992CF2|nr:hypothetical protein [Herbaspirillum sp. meg3]ASU38186.1 hypothetical protein hmeg3_07665 [Herbaspirillum sp. meg3]
MPSQIGVTPGLASYTDCFPPLTFTPLASGGVPPFGADFNGILNAITQAVRWACAGGQYPYDATFSTAVGGYPAGAIVQRADGTGEWLNLTDNNTTNPETGGAGWVPMDNYGITAVTGLTNTNVTLTALQYARNTTTFAGTLTGNVQIIFPATLQTWTVINNTTGAFTVTCKTASGTGAAVAQGGQQLFWGDGTNLNTLSGNSAIVLNVGNATAPTHAMNQQTADARYALSASAMGKNRFINGAMVIDQRNAGASKTFTAAAVLHRSLVCILHRCQHYWTAL